MAFQIAALKPMFSASKVASIRQFCSKTPIKNDPSFDSQSVLGFKLLAALIPAACTWLATMRSDGSKERRLGHREMIKDAEKINAERVKEIEQRKKEIEMKIWGQMLANGMLELKMENRLMVLKGMDLKDKIRMK